MDLRSESRDPELARAIHRDWQSASLSATDTALLGFAEKLTRTPAATGQADVDALRAVGLSDAAVHDLVQVVSYFNYINRVADGLGTDPETDFPASGGS